MKHGETYRRNGRSAAIYYHKDNDCYRALLTEGLEHRQRYAHTRSQVEAIANSWLNGDDSWAAIGYGDERLDGRL